MSRKDYAEGKVTVGKLPELDELKNEIKELEKIIVYYEEVLIAAHMQSFLVPDHPQFFNPH